MSKKIYDKLIRWFFDHPLRAYHVRELGRLCEVDPLTARKYADEFVKEGMLQKRRERGHVLYQANSENTPYRWEKIFHNIRSILKSGLIEYLEKELHHPKTIILFGSFAKGENDERSDIDLFILAEVKKEVSLEKFEKTLGYPIQLFCHSQEEFDKMKTTNRELLNNFIGGIKLSGYTEVFR